MMYGVGVGPGDPDLITIKAVKVLKSAEMVFCPSSGQEKESMALSIVRDYLPGGCRIIPVHLPMTRERQRLEAAWERVGQEITACLEAGKRVVFLTVGDPMLYSTYIYIYRKVRAKGYPVETVPGVPSFCAAAAAAGVPLGEGDEKIAIIPWSPGESRIGRWTQHFSSFVFMKVSSDFSGVRNVMSEEGLLQESVLVSRCGYADERVEADLASLEERDVDYFSLILARRKNS